MRVVLVGESFEVEHALKQPAIAHCATLQVVAVVPLIRSAGRFPEQEIRTIVSETHADTLLLVGGLSRSALLRFGELAVVLGRQLMFFLPDSSDAGNVPVLVWRAEHHSPEVAGVSDRPWFDLAKRCADVTLAALGLIVAAPLILLGAAAVRLESPGNPFFGHTRIGVGGRRFRCWKLRTMHEDAEDRLLQVETLMEQYIQHGFKLPDESDPRVTGVGRFLRKTSLDELPQLWNVLVGDMSLVGPRPIVAEELKHYAGSILQLLSVRPGVTGAWAVNGRHHLQYPERAQIELDYVRTRSLAGDIRVLWRTVGAVLDPGSTMPGEKLSAAEKQVLTEAPGLAEKSVPRARVEPAPAG
jgi:exopolysaccharide production protein ExoY